jgi:diaminopropionate ammonia-lyase
LGSFERARIKGLSVSDTGLSAAKENNMQTRKQASGIDYLMADPTGKDLPAGFSEHMSRQVLRFHRKLPDYQPTRLVHLEQLARSWGVSDVWVKDESTRFGLGAFKVLGGSYAIARLLCQKLGRDIDDIAYDDLVSEDVRKRLGQMTFATATDGNHGRGVAWAAEQLKQQAIIYMPKGSALSRVANIRSHGAHVEVTNLNYDDAVRLCCRKAREQDWVVVQDTVWEGYTHVPQWIMQGYMTLCAETVDQMVSTEAAAPTHVFIQAGVGAFAGAMVGYLVNKYRQSPPRFTIMEPRRAACIFSSIAAGDGQPHRVSGDLKTIMAGLACGEPNIIAWDILRDFCSCYISCDDFVAADGIRILANPLAGDSAVEAGESGAVGIGLLERVCHHPDLHSLKQKLAIGPDSRLLFFNTEGATDPYNRREILWYGKYPNPLDTH